MQFNVILNISNIFLFQTTPIRISIPEEIYSKSLPEREKRIRATTLLPKLTPKGQARRSQNPQTASLLSSSSTETEDEDEYHDRVDDDDYGNDDDDETDSKKDARNGMVNI